MEELTKKRVRNLLLIADADIKAAKLIIRLPEKQSTKKLAGHIRYAMDNLQEVLALVEVKPQQPDGDDALQGVLLDLESLEPVSGKIVLTPNGIEPSKEDDAG